uniref:Uncharacterized protein n=1 Tax=Rhizophora mucronata TaxID=61149 RepID=A0A2P2NHU3_RHIMU
MFIIRNKIKIISVIASKPKRMKCFFIQEENNNKMLIIIKNKDAHIVCHNFLSSSTGNEL